MLLLTWRLYNPSLFLSILGFCGSAFLSWRLNFLCSNIMNKNDLIKLINCWKISPVPSSCSHCWAYSNLSKTNRACVGHTFSISPALSDSPLSWNPLGSYGNSFSQVVTEFTGAPLDSFAYFGRSMIQNLNEFCFEFSFTPLTSGR